MHAHIGIVENTSVISLHVIETPKRKTMNDPSVKITLSIVVSMPLIDVSL